MLGTVAANGILSVAGGFFLAGVGSLSKGSSVSLPEFKGADLQTFLDGYAFLDDPHLGPRVPIGRGEFVAAFEDEALEVHLEASRALMVLIAGGIAAPQGWNWETSFISRGQRRMVDGFQAMRVQGSSFFQVRHRFSPRGFRLRLKRGALGPSEGVPYVVHAITPTQNRLEVATEANSFHLASLARGSVGQFSAETLGSYRAVRGILDEPSVHAEPDHAANPS